MHAPPTSPNEEHLLAAVAAGERDALARLYDLHAPTLQLELAAANLDTQTIAETIHRIFVQLWVAAPRLDPTVPAENYVQQLMAVQRSATSHIAHF